MSRQNHYFNLAHHLFCCPDDHVFSRHTAETNLAFLVIAQELHFIVVEVGSVDAQLLAGDPLSAAHGLQVLPGHQAGQATACRCNTHRGHSLWQQHHDAAQC